jgi:hypothetical protein
MPTMTLTTSSEFALRMKAAIINEKPELANATNTLINAAIQKKARNFMADWVHKYEASMAVTTAANSVVYPSDADIT